MQAEELPFDVVASAGSILGESATWCGRTGVLWWVDIRAPSLSCWTASTGAIQSWPMPELCAAVLTTASDTVVLALRNGLHAFDPRDASLTPLVTLEKDAPAEHRLNEARCDRQGRLWCGSMWDFGKHATGALYRIDAGLQVRKQREEVTVPNGIAFSPDSRHMYFVDTPTGRIEVADYDDRQGMPGPWRSFVEPGIVDGRPDGSTVDADGCLWSTRSGAGLLARFTPDGRLDRLIRLPVSQPTSCVFGGAGLDTLYVTSATQRLTPEALAAQPLAGALIALRPSVRGLPEPAFAWNPRPSSP